MVDIDSFDIDDVERYADTLAAVAAAIASGGTDAGAAALEPIAGQVWTGRLTSARGPDSGTRERRPRPSDDNLRARVFVRDQFRCTACGGRAVPLSILVATHDVFPEAIGYDPHYGRGRMHPVFWALAPEADHIYPHARGGENTLDNLTTLHAACNTRKADSLVTGSPPPSIPPMDGAWDGLTSFYPALISAGAGEARPTYHGAWSRRYATFMAQ